MHPTCLDLGRQDRVSQLKQMNWLLTTKRNRAMAPFRAERNSSEWLEEVLLAHPGFRESYPVGGAPDTIRTCGLRLRRATLYPAERRVLKCSGGKTIRAGSLSL